ncbi:MAG: CDP-alcohol phosphatidyltransferase family protein [Mogibacterium sp.]|nr:CDP-alcohol phosphatidyltransferase family protein [Mogibacterium sp.]MBR0342475.1 CDP-alcohol phosphatidyltransferase family protein [Oscillospiraceae bacterium]
MANIITGIRIVISVMLLFCPALSPVFLIFYIIAGIADMADGAVARKTGTVSEFGSKLDTVADAVFVAVCLIKNVACTACTSMAIHMDYSHSIY